MTRNEPRAIQGDEFNERNREAPSTPPTHNLCAGTSDAIGHNDLGERGCRNPEGAASHQDSSAAAIARQGRPASPQCEPGADGVEMPDVMAKRVTDHANSGLGWADWRWATMGPARGARGACSAPRFCVHWTRNQ